MFGKSIYLYRVLIASNAVKINCFVFTHLRAINISVIDYTFSYEEQMIGNCTFLELLKL